MRGLRLVRCRSRWHSVSGSVNRFPPAALPVPPSLSRIRCESRLVDVDLRLEDALQDRSIQNNMTAIDKVIKHDAIAMVTRLFHLKYY